MSQFVINVLGPRDCVCDFCPQKFTKTLLEPMHRHFHGPFAQVQMSGNFRIRSGALIAPNETFQFLEKPRLIRRVEFLTLSGQEWAY